MTRAPFACSLCPQTFRSSSELALHNRVHFAMSGMTAGKYNGSAVRQHVPARTQAMDMLDEGEPTMALRFVIRRIQVQGGEPREVRILQQAWCMDEAQGIFQWRDVPSFEEVRE